MSLGIRSRLFLTSVGVITIVGGLSAIYLQNELRSLLESQAENHIIHLAKAARNVVESETSSTTDIKDFDKIADRLAKATEARITIVLTNGQVVGDSALNIAEVEKIENHIDRPEIQTAQSQSFGLSRRYSTTLDQMMLYVAVPFSSARRAGFLRAALPLEAIGAFTNRLWVLIGFAGVIGLVLTTMMIFLASHWMTTDLRRVVMKAKMMSRKSSKSLRPTSTIDRDEIGLLEGSINLLGQQLEKFVSDLGGERDRFETVLRELNDSVVALDGAGDITIMNEEARLMLDLPSSAVGQSLSNYIDHPELINVIEQGQSVPSRAEFPLGDSDAHIVLAHARPLKSSDGLVLVLHDMSEIRKLEGLRKDFIANVSHELRTPVSIIRANSETLLDGGLSDEKHARRFVEAQLRNAKRLTALIDDILDLSKIEADKYPINLEEIQLSTIVEDVLSSLQNAADAKKIELRSLVDSEMIAFCDSKALVHVVTNLVDNAIKYSPTLGTVHVSLNQESEQFVTVSVLDNGPGVDEEHRSRLFERFYRIDTGRSREAGGTGLGLAIVKHLVESMNGEVGYDARPGGGSNFWFRLRTAEG